MSNRRFHVGDTFPDRPAAKKKLVHYDVLFCICHEESPPANGIDIVISKYALRTVEPKLTF